MSKSARRATLIVLAAGGICGLAIALAAIRGSPYLDLDGLNPWIVVFAVSAFAFLFALPFAIEGMVGGTLEADARWERALLVWAAVTLGLLAAALLVGLPAGFSSDSLAGSAGLVVAVEAVLVLATIAVWMLEG